MKPSSLTLREECEASKKALKERDERRTRSRSRSRSRSRGRSYTDQFGRQRQVRSRSRSRSRSLDRDRDRHRRRRSRSRSSERRYSSRGNDTVGTATNSSDPKLLKSRVFVGRLPTDKLTRQELESIFLQHGKVLGVSMLKGYGFIQYENEEDACKAVDAEHQSLLKGSNLDVKLAMDGRRPTLGNSSDRGDRDRGDRDRDRDRHVSRERSPVRAPRDPYGYDEPYRRGALPPRVPYDPYDPYRRAPPGSYRDPYRDAYYPPPPPVVVPVAPPVPNRPAYDMEIILLDGKYREYAEMIDSRVRRLGMLTGLNVLRSEGQLQTAMDEANRKKLPFAVVLNEQNEQHRSLTVNILHGTPQEHRNMPLDDALTLVGRNFDDYLADLRKKATPAPAPVPVPVVVAAPPPPAPAPKPNFEPPSPHIQYLLNLMADSRFLTLQEIDDLMEYIKQRRKHLVGTASASDLKDKEDVLALQQQELQNKILSLLNGTPGLEQRLSQQQPPPQPQPPPPPQPQPQQQALGSLQSPFLQTQHTPQPVPPPPKSQASSLASAINLDNPSIQRALDSLIHSGNILENISGVSGINQSKSSANNGGGSSGIQGVAYQGSSGERVVNYGIGDNYSSSSGGISRQQQQPPPPPQRKATNRNAIGGFPY